MGALDRAELVQPATRREWREWLEANHGTSPGAWLVTGRAGSDLPRLGYEESVEEALCFGWIDGQAGTIDENRSRQYFAPRRPGSPWARTNKERVERLTTAGLMRPAGQAVIDRAKADGSWSMFDSVDRLELPPALASALASRPAARANWDAWPDGVKRQVLSSLVLTKREETRLRKIEQYADAAARNERPAR